MPGVFESKAGARFVGLLASVLLLLSASGCMATELNERSIVSMVGIDREDNGDYTVTLGLIGSKKQGVQEQETVSIHAVQGETLYEAARKFILRTGNQLLWTYIKVIVLGPSTADTDMTILMDFFNRNNEIQPNPYIVYAQVPARDIMKMNMDAPTLPTHILERQIKNQSLLSTAPEVTLYQWNEMLLSSEKAAYASVVRTVRHEGNQIPAVEGMAVFRNGVKKGELGARETRGVLWVRHEVRGGILVIPVPSQQDKNETKLSLEVTKKNKAQIQPELTDQGLKLHLTIRAKLAIGEVMGDLRMDPQDMLAIRSRAEDEIRHEIESSLAQTQKKLKADIYGFGDAVHRKYPEYWNRHKAEWPEIFGELPVDITVQADVERFGLLETL